MQIHNRMSPTGDVSFYDESFLQVIEDHKTFLLNDANTMLVDINPHLSDKHQGDLFGLLDALHVGKQYHYAIMVVNGYRSPSDFLDTDTNLVMPSTDTIDMLRRIHTARTASL